MNFGPLNAEGGERRLNVLISRARERCEVFSSITADDIDLQRTKSRGAAALKTFLRYAATGDLDASPPASDDVDSNFERQVAVELQGRGYDVHRQVGSAGIRIDLAVVDSARPGQYLLGIECDGATYHSARWARDRDRLREAVLRERGWRIHRVWSTDWFHRPAEQLKKLVAAIDAARRDANAEEVDDATHDELSAPVASDETDIERAEQTAELDTDLQTWVVPYVEATLDVPSTNPIPETSVSVLADIVAGIVQVEGPIHRDEVARRITLLWGLERTGARIAESIAGAIDGGVRSGILRADTGFVSHSQQTTVPVRNRANVVSTNLKKPEMIPHAEVRQAVLHVVREHVGIGRNEIPALVARAFGFRVTSAKLRERIERVVAQIVAEDLLTLREEKLFLAADPAQSVRAPVDT
jgi:very-short-patch-repair endonuclease